MVASLLHSWYSSLPLQCLPRFSLTSESGPAARCYLDADGDRKPDSQVNVCNTIKTQVLKINWLSLIYMVLWCKCMPHLGPLCWLLSARLRPYFPVAWNSTQYNCWAALLHHSLKLFRHQSTEEMSFRWHLGAVRHQFLHFQEYNKKSHLPSDD